jgi:hypothetical protein
MKATISTLAVIPFFIMSGSGLAAGLYRLSDLSARSQAQLFEQIDAYGLLAAFLNACKRPPHIVERLSPIAKDCVDDDSFQLAVNRFNDAVKNNSGTYKCDGPGVMEHMIKFEGKIEAVVRNFSMACRVHSFVGASFPDAGAP